MAKKKSKGKILSDQQITNKYGGGRASVIALPPEKILRIPTRSIAMNYQLNGGAPYGKILELFGEESTGKSLLAQDLGYVTQQLGGEVIWADAENSFNGSWFEKNGLNLENIHLLTEQPAMEVISDWVQDTIISVRTRLTHNEPILFVLDSIAAIRCAAEIGESQMDAKAKFGNRAKAISDFLGNRNQLFAKAGVTVVTINQLRRKIGASKFEDPDKTVGGDALKFYAAQRVEVVRGKQIKRPNKNGKERKVGHNAYIRTKKDKTGPPRPTTETQIYFIGSKANPIGFSRYMGLPELLVDTGALERQKGSSRYYKDGKMIANGEEALLKKLMQEDDFRKKMIALSKINTISKTRQQIDSLKSNLFKI